MKHNTLILSTLFMIAIALSIVFMLINNKAIHHQSITIHPDVFINNMKMITINNKGQLKSQLESPNLIHYKKNKTASLNHPKLLIYTQDRIPWTITADKGKVVDSQADNHGKKIILSGNVILHQKSLPRHPETWMKTQRLVFFPKSSIATTDDLITITQPRGSITGKGLRANFKNGDYQILSQAKEVYHAPH